MKMVETLFGPWRAPKKSLRFKVICPTYKQLLVGEVYEEYLQKKFTTPADVYEKFTFLVDECKEYFYVLHLDGKNRILCLDLVSIGSLNQSIVHPREVFKSSLLSSAASLILIHNHPTLSLQPSSEDIEITKRLVECGNLLGIKVLDHIIIGDGFYSFAENHRI